MMEWLIQRGSTFAGDIDFIIDLVAVLGGFWLLLAEAVFFYFIWKFHRSRSPKAQYITGERKEEMKWIHLPHNLVLVCDVFIIIFAVKAWYKVKQDLPPAEETVAVVGHQWAWEFQHPGASGKLGDPGDIGTVDELHVVVDRTYHFKLSSADVVHDFSVPIFRLKQDAIPGREITGWFKPTKTGTFDIQCAKMCGFGHGIMGARLFVETPEEHKKWMASKLTAEAVTAPTTQVAANVDNAPKAPAVISINDPKSVGITNRN